MTECPDCPKCGHKHRFSTCTCGCMEMNKDSMTELDLAEALEKLEALLEQVREIHLKSTE